MKNNKLFEEFSKKAKKLEPMETLTLLVQKESLTISTMVHKYDLRHKDWGKVFEEQLENLEKLCNEFNIPFELGSVEITVHDSSIEFQYGKIAMIKRERDRQLWETLRKR